MASTDKEISTKCPCCSRDFPTLSQLLEHMKMKHTEDEILACAVDAATTLEAYVA